MPLWRIRRARAARQNEFSSERWRNLRDTVYNGAHSCAHKIWSLGVMSFSLAAVLREVDLPALVMGLGEFNE
jgi:hypothetical protein